MNYPFDSLVLESGSVRFFGDSCSFVHGRERVDDRCRIRIRHRDTRRSSSQDVLHYNLHGDVDLGAEMDVFDQQEVRRTET